MRRSVGVVLSVSLIAFAPRVVGAQPPSSVDSLVLERTL